MTDNINDLIGQKVFDDIDKLDAKMKVIEDRFTTTAKAAVAMAASLGDFSKIKEMAKQVDDIEGKLKKLNNTQKEYTLTQAAIDVQSSKNRRALKEQAEAANDLTNGYRRLELEQKKAEQEAKQMAVTYGITSKAFQEAANKSNGMLNQLKAIDAQLGKAQRNVGNYGQAVFSLSQVFREMPAFAYSASQGVLALSNNLPILVDNFQQTVKSAGSTTAALGIFARSIFSFGNIFTLAISALTIWMARTEMAGNKAKEAAEAVDEYGQQIAKETALLMVLKKAIEDTNQPMDKRISAINMLKETWPAYFDGLSNEALLTGQIADAYNQATAAIERKARANVAMKDIEKKIVELNKAEKELQDFYDTQAKNPLNPGTTQYGMEVLDLQMQAIKNKKEQIQLLNEELKKLVQINVANTDYYGTPKGGGKAGKPAQETRDKSIDMDQLKIQQQEVLKGRDELAKKLELNPVSVHFKWTLAEEIEAFAEKAVPQLMQLQRNLDDITSAIGNIADATFEREMAQLDTKEKRLQEYYDNEKRFIEQTGLSAAKKEKMRQKLDAETEAKRKQIDRDRITAQRKQATIEKAITLTQIVISTALAVMRALAEKELPFYVKVINAASAGLLGAAQFAKAASAPLPQYAKGRKGGKAEFAVVGEQGHEVIRHADGSMELTPNRPTVTFLPEGADVIPNHELLKQAAYVKLQGVQNVTSDKYGAALLAAFEENTKETRELKQIMASKEYSMKIKTLDGYRSFIESKLR